MGVSGLNNRHLFSHSWFWRLESLKSRCWQIQFLVRLVFQLVDGCLLTTSSHALSLVSLRTVSSLMCLPIRTLILLDQNLNFMTALNLNFP